MDGIINSRLISNQGSGVTLVGSKAVAITPSDTDNISPCNLYVGTGGDIKVLLQSDLETPVIFKNVPSGVFLPILAARIYSTDTDADDILAIY